jgi:RND family efflux transporter MFP subunit
MKIILRLVVVLLAGALLATLLYSGFRARRQDRVELDTTVRDNARLAVSVGHAKPTVPGTEATFPANIQAFVETPIYARTNGYLKRWLVDLGAHVESGQLLAEIETPEVDQQLRQSEAMVASLQASVDLDRTTAVRYQQLLKSDGVSKQEVDQAVGTQRTDEGRLNAAVADVDRWKEMQSFKQVKAPFTGTITARNVDTGALISAGTNTVLFHLADTSTLRVFTNVTETFSHSIKVGIAGTLEVPSNPGPKYTGAVVRTAGTMDPTTRTLLTELQVRNPGGTLKPGEYGQVTFQIKPAGSSLIVAASALLFRAAGTEIAVVDETGKVHMHSVKLGRDFGRTVEVVSGLAASDTVILNPADSIGEGSLVKPVFAEKTAEKAP